MSVMNVVTSTHPIGAVLGFVTGRVSISGEIFVRLLGVETFIAAMFMVLVAQKVESVWWWSWAFVLADIAIAAVVIVHVLFGLQPGAAALRWWIVAATCLGFGAALLWGLFKGAQDQPIIDV